MSAEIFESTLRQLCRDAGIADEPHFLEQRLVIVDDLPMRVDYFADLEALHIEVDLGPAPADPNGHYARFLLACNLESQDAGHPSFALHPETGHVVLSLRVALSHVGIDNPLHDVLTHSVPAVVDEWRAVLQDFEDAGFAGIASNAAGERAAD